MSNLRILIIAVILFSLLGTGFISGETSETLKRKVNIQIVVDQNGKAKMNRQEDVEPSVLGDLYCKHAEDVEKDEKVKEQFLYESAKGHGLIFGYKPKLKINNQKINNQKIKNQKIKKKGKNIHSSLTRKVEGEFPSLARSMLKGKKVVKEIRIRQFDEKNEKDKQEAIQKYLEYVLDSRLFESAFLRSVDGEQKLESIEVTEFKLPDNAKIINEEDLEVQNWQVDFGKGNIMQAEINVDADNRLITLEEQIVVSENAPENLLAEDNTFFIENLRKYGSFVIQYETDDSSSQGEPAPDPSPSVGGRDFYSQWDLGVSETLSAAFTYQPSPQVSVKVTPSINLSFNLGATIKWEWRWYWSGWWLRCTIDYFETTLSLEPAVRANISISGNASIDADWDKTIGKKSRTFTFWVGCVPVVIVLEADLSLKASCDLEGAIEIGTGGAVTLNTGITCRYQNGWNASNFFNLTHNFNGFEASAGIEAKARAEAPFTVSAYIYDVAGPFAQLNPYIEASSKAEATITGQTSIHYKLNGGFEVNGGAKVAGWLEGLLGNLGQYTRTFYTKDVTIYEGNIRRDGPGKTSAEPSSAAFNNRLYCVYKANDPSNEIYVTSTSDDKKWDPPYKIQGRSTSAGPALAVLNNKLYCIYKANDPSNAIYVISTSDGENWSKSYFIPNRSTSAGPALAVFNNKLYCIYKANDPSNAIYVISTSDGNNWDLPYRIQGQSTSAGPATAVFNNKLYCIYKANDPSNSIWVASTKDGVNWEAFPIKQETSASPSLAAFNNRLYCVYKANGPSNEIYVTSTSDGTSWGSLYYIPRQSTSAGPALAVFNGRLYCVYKANDPSNDILVTSTSDGAKWE